MHTAGKCINVSETLVPYKIIYIHSIQYLTCMQVNTHQCGWACRYKAINVSKSTEVAKLWFLCVSRLSCLSLLAYYAHILTHTFTAVSDTHTCSQLRHTQIVCTSVALHACTHVTNTCVAEAQLTAWQSLWNWHPSHTDARCFAWPSGVLGVSLCQKCWVALNGRERMGGNMLCVPVSPAAWLRWNVARPKRN